MNIILMYDISSSNKNLNKVRKICTKYLLHIQNSVFEGELETRDILNLEKEITSIIDKKIDSIYLFKSINTLNKKIIGLNKNEFDGFNL